MIDRRGANPCTEDNILARRHKSEGPGIKSKCWKRFPCEISDKVYLYIHAPCRGIYALDKCELYDVLIVTRTHAEEVQYTDFENRASRKFLVGSGCGSDG